LTVTLLSDDELALPAQAPIASASQNGASLSFGMSSRGNTLSINKRDHVGVLLNRAGFTEIGKLRSLVLSAQPTGELGQGEYWDCEFLGQRLQAQRSRLPPDLSAVLALCTRHQLKVVDHQEPNVVLALPAAGLAQT
jgi:hypothetical protein